MNLDSPSISRRFIVTGKVQGVFFRASTRKQALELGLSGYAKNLASGQVEVLMQGSANACEYLQNWLHTGPQYARVDSVVEVDASATPNLLEFKTL